MSTCPTVHGEKVVLRILDNMQNALAIESLGLLDAQQKIFRDAISSPQGLILVAGPTGSGKTVTLYSALQYLNTLGRNISTIEDPVEIQLHGINQINISPKIGLTFPNMLRAILRQDPDVIMVGEIRDLETAEIAIQAALTGHLVLSTIHTNSALDTMTRLQGMGIAGYQLANSISLIIAQRLVRKLCLHCRLPDALAESAAYRAGTCAQCLQGYKGRTGIYELLPNPALNPEFMNLTTAGKLKVREGITSLNEIHRVLRI
jgi:type IV pilus assembly protein PilB